MNAKRARRRRRRDDSPAGCLRALHFVGRSNFEEDARFLRRCPSKRAASGVVSLAGLRRLQTFAIVLARSNFSSLLLACGQLDDSATNKRRQFACVSTLSGVRARAREEKIMRTRARGGGGGGVELL